MTPSVKHLLLATTLLTPIASHSLPVKASIAPDAAVKAVDFAPLGFAHPRIVKVNIAPDGGGINGDGGAGLGFGDAGFEGADPGGGGGGMGSGGGGGGDQGGDDGSGDDGGDDGAC